MDGITSDEPPAKRRRFFAEASEHVSVSAIETTSKKRFFNDVDTIKDEPIPLREPLRETTTNGAHSRSRSPPADAGPSKQNATPSGFDQDTLEAFVGAKIAPDVAQILREKCGDDIERAVNMYLDGTWKTYAKKAAQPTNSGVRAFAKSSNKEAEQPRRPPPTSMNGARYIGAFGVGGWMTRSGTNLLKHGDLVKIERQQTKAAKAATTGPRGRKVDVLVRFCDNEGRELGRLEKESASWVSALIDQKIASFEASCVYAPEKLRTNDTVYLQLKCFLLKSAFDSRGFTLSDNRTTGFLEEKETVEERDLRTRQIALVKLFQETNLNPTRANAAAARQQRQSLIDAAEAAEKKEKEPADAKSNGATPGTPVSDDAEPEDGQELEQDQLDSLYKKAQSFDFSTPEAEPADTFAMTLRPYQKQALHWMMSKEKDEKAKGAELSMHPLWEEYAWPTKDVDGLDLPEHPNQPRFYANPYSGDLSLDFPVQEQHCLGGILADEMGLGKTIQMLSLIHSHRSDIAREAAASLVNGKASVNDLPRMSAKNAGPVSAPCTTLVVAPMSLLAQWQSETEAASKEGTIKSLIYYGADKAINLRHLCCEANAASATDVIITSYGVVLSEFTQIASKTGGKDLAHNGLFSLNYFRIILDEAHNIKNRQSKTAKACYELMAEHRWVLTGTPIVNKLEDLFSLVRFLRVEPWNNFSFWRTFITVPFESKDFMRALDVVQTVLEPLVMRRTKDMKTPDGQPLVALPPKHVSLVDVQLTKTERDVYDFVYKRAKSTFQANVAAGTVMKAFTTIFAQLLRLRQSCCHPSLVRHEGVLADEDEAGAAEDAATGFADDMDLQSLIERFTATTDDPADSNTFGANVLTEIRDQAENECPICSEEPMIDQMVTGCWHAACKRCLLDYIEHQTNRHELPRCFNCRALLNTRDLFEVVRHDDEPSIDGAPRISLQRYGATSSSSKIMTLVKHLRELRKEHPTMKSVVFSQFTSFMSLIEPALAKANMQCLRLDGSMAQKARVEVLNEFRASDKFTILLISLRAGGVGLNLVSAKRVYMMDPWWSFAVEAQAIDRVHRMGQEDEVKVYRFIVKDSVEERMLRVQDRKKFIATSLGMMSDEEKKLQRIEDIKELLS